MDGGGVSTSLLPEGNSGRLTWRVKHSSRKSSASHSYQCVQYFPVSRRWCGCQWGFFVFCFLTCAQMLMRAIRRMPHQGLKPASVSRLAFQSDVVPTELSPPFNSWFPGQSLCLTVFPTTVGRAKLRTRKLYCWHWRGPHHPWTCPCHRLNNYGSDGDSRRFLFLPVGVLGTGYSQSPGLPSAPPPSHHTHTLFRL